jgi:hypothetical protein
VSGSDFCLGVVIDSPLGLDPYTALCPLCVVTSNVHICALDYHDGPPSGAFQNARGCILCHQQALAVVFSDDLETSNISKGSSEVPSPAIDYPSSKSGSLVLSRDNNRPRMAGHRTCLARRQVAVVVGDLHSS